MLVRFDLGVIHSAMNSAGRLIPAAIFSNAAEAKLLNPAIIGLFDRHDVAVERQNEVSWSGETTESSCSTSKLGAGQLSL